MATLTEELCYKQYGYNVKLIIAKTRVYLNGKITNITILYIFMVTLHNCFNILVKN